jgi:hypothetical protein
MVKIMTNTYSMDDLLSFLDHAAKRGLMPAATAQAMGVASRNVLGVLTEDEKKDLGQVDIDAVISRFTNKRAKDFNPSSLKVYDQRARRAITLFLDWRNDPANFTVKTRAPRNTAKRRNGTPDNRSQAPDAPAAAVPTKIDGTYQSSLPVRPGVVVTLMNIPTDLTPVEAERLAGFIKMLAVK